MFCPKCGQQAGDAANFCLLCGVRISSTTARDVIASATQWPPIPETGRKSASLTPDRLRQAGGTVYVPGLCPGQVLANRYEIQELLGEGGMGQVWKVQDRELKSAFALKVLPPLLANNPQAVEAMKREAALSLKLTHANICRLHNFHREDSLGFLVMELLDGQTLDHLLNDKPERRMKLEEAIPIFEKVAAALDFAHGQLPPILHRDIKPANIMVGDTGWVKVMDFGIACELNNTMTRMTGRGSAGTLLYMSPQQLRGVKLSPASDVYSVAASLYECLAGHPEVLGYLWTVQRLILRGIGRTVRCPALA